MKGNRSSLPAFGAGIRAASILGLSVLSLLGACKAEPPEDGAGPALKIAEALCEQMWSCEDEQELGHLWASVEQCALSQAARVGMAGLAEPSLTASRVACDQELEVELDADVLAECLVAMGSMSCEETFATAYTHPYLPGACEPFFEAWIAAENAWRGGNDDGEPCAIAFANQCHLGSHCVQPPDQDQAICEPRWLNEGDDCLDELDQPLDCGPRLFCVDGVCRRDPPQAGETCAHADQCAPGVDCDRFTGRCVQQFRAGGACDAQEACGRWFMCEEGRCQPRLSALGSLGAECDGPGQCPRGACVDGSCRAAPGEGEACLTECEGGRCDHPCQKPLICVDGTCEQPASCGEAEAGDACSDHYQCPAGHVCDVRGLGEDLVCRSVPTAA